MKRELLDDATTDDVFAAEVAWSSEEGERHVRVAVTIKNPTTAADMYRKMVANSLDDFDVDSATVFSSLGIAVEKGFTGFGLVFDEERLNALINVLQQAHHEAFGRPAAV